MTHVPPADASARRPVPEPPPVAPDATGRSLVGPRWAGAEILLVADRKPGSSHKFFHKWRIEVVAGAEKAVPGLTLFTIPIRRQLLIDSGWQYRLRRQAPRPGFEALATATFAWVTETEGRTPDPIAAAHAQARDWLIAAAVPSAVPSAVPYVDPVSAREPGGQGRSLTSPRPDEVDDEPSRGAIQ